MIYEKLYSWQKTIVDKFKERDTFGLFLDMGLGKTPVSLAFAEQNNCAKVIVITINAKATETIEIGGSWLNWASQSSIKYIFHNKKSSQSTFMSNVPEMLLVNYESLFIRGNNCERTQRITLKDNIKAFINSCKGHNVAIIVDESHKIKNLSSLQTGAIMQIKKLLEITSNRVFTYLLTGTPFTTGYIDLYAQLKILGCNLTKSQFVDAFCVRGNVPGLLGWQQPIASYKNIDELYRLIHRFALTIKSEEVVELPQRVFVEHLLPCNSTFNIFTHEFVEGFDILAEEAKHKDKLNDGIDYRHDKKFGNPYYRNIAYPDLKWIADTAGTFWLRARQLSAGFQGNASESIWYDKTRVIALQNFLERYEDNYVIFYNYTPEMFEIFDVCEQLGYNVDVYCGDIKYLTFYEKFCKLSDGEKLTTKKNIILANFASGSTGMNWQEYNKCIIFSLPLFKDYEQALKRVHRLGQKNTVVYHLFYQKNWLDIGMKKALDEAKQYNQDMFDDDLKRIQEILCDNKEGI